MHIVLHCTYNTVEIAFCCQDSIIDTLSIDKYQASAQLLVALATLCERQAIASSQIEFIVAHVGPGPFTTLRTVLATANGLALAHNLKMVAIDGLHALLAEYHDDIYPVTVALLNAYSNDLYYAVENQGHLRTGILYGGEELKVLLQQLPTRTVRFIGNGVSIHGKLIQEICGERTFIPIPNPETCSLQIVAKLGYQKWLAKEDIHDQLMPLYLKKY